METIQVDAEHVRTGDYIDFLGTLYKVAEFRPHPGLTFNGKHYRGRIAVDVDGWEMTLLEGDRVEVLR